MKIPALVIIWSLVTGHCSFADPGLYLAYPPDKTITSASTLMLSGRAKNVSSLMVNNRKIKIDSDGKFGCGLVLHRGKNYVIVKALRAGGKTEVKKLHLIQRQSFPDIVKHWAKNKIINLATLGFIEGSPDGSFYPQQPITRGELATWLARVKGLPRRLLNRDPFLDVPKEHWRAPAIFAVTQKKYMKGISPKHFGLDEPLMRSEAAYIAAKAEGLEILWTAKKLFFRDVTSKIAEAPPINTAKKKGLVIGVSPDTPLFEPYRSLTRAEAAVLLSRFKRAAESVAYLYDFKKGFSEKVFAKVNIAPEIASLNIEPNSVYVNTENIIKIRAKVSSRRGFYPISKVKADLTSIGGIADAEMFDDGSSGDEVKDDGIYSLNLKLNITESGERNFKATAIDSLGWEGSSSAKLFVVK